MGIRIDLGETKERNAPPGPLLMDVEELLATRLLIQGNSGSGKSHLIRRLLEQSAPHVQQCIIDPEGDFTSLSDAYGHIVVDANRTEAELVAIANKVRERRASVVLNLESLEVDQQMRAAGWFLNALFDAPREIWYPMLIVVDEAQLFAPAASGDVAEDARKLSLGAMTNLMCRGRKRGLCGVIATQRLAKLAKNVAAEASNFCMGRTFLDIDMARAADLLGMDRQRAEMFRELGRGNFVALGPAVSRKPLPFMGGGVTTQARGSTPKLSPPPTLADEAEREDILAPLPKGPSRPLVPKRVPELPPIQGLLDSIPDPHAEGDGVPLPSDAEVSLGEGFPMPMPMPMPGGVVPEGAPRAAAPVVDEGERLRTMRGILAEIMSQENAHAKIDGEVSRDYEIQCRIRKVPGRPYTLRELGPHILLARAGIDPERVDSEEWAQVREVAGQIHESERLPYLYLARSAQDGEPCPSNMAIARVCNMASAGLAGKRVERLERDNFVIVKTDMRGNRRLTFPDVGWETEFGDPKADRAVTFAKAG